MITLFKNQRNLFILTAGSIFIITMGWYFGYQQQFSSGYTQTKSSIDKLSRVRDNYRKKQGELKSIENEWELLNDEFQIILNKIPSKTGYNQVSDALYKLLKSYNLTIKNYSPSALAVEMKTITLPGTDDKITIEKIPIDVVIKGSFINFGRMLEQMEHNQYRLTVSAITMVRSDKEQEQDIQFIAYAYFKSSGDDHSTVATQWHQPAEQEMTSNTVNQIGGIVTMPWKGEEVIIGIDNPTYTSDGLAIYPIEFEDGRKEFVEKAEIPSHLFDNRLTDKLPFSVNKKPETPDPEKAKEAVDFLKQFSE